MIEHKIVSKATIMSAAPFVEDAAYVQYIKETYIDTGRVTVDASRRDAEGIAVTTVTFNTLEDKQAWETDPRLLENLELKKAHNAANGIVRVNSERVD